MVIHILVRRHLYIETPPDSFYGGQQSVEFTSFSNLQGTFVSDQIILSIEYDILAISDKNKANIDMVGFYMLL